MAERRKINIPFCNFPTEILCEIFLNLPAKDLMKCRKVCTRWKAIIDTLAVKDQLWVRHCRRDFEDCYGAAKKKADIDLSPFNLYRSLSLWPKMGYTVMKIEEFTIASSSIDEIRSVEVIGNRTIGVHKNNRIEYYDIDTLEPASRIPIIGDYHTYKENDTIIVLLTEQFQLLVIKKPNENMPEQRALFEDVKKFLFTDTEFFIVKVNNEIFRCNISDEQGITCTYIQHTEDSDAIMSLGLKNGSLNILTYQLNIYTIEKDNQMVFKTTLDAQQNILHVLNEYNLLELVDWGIYYQWMCVFNNIVPKAPMRFLIMNMWLYGDIFFVGNNFGVLRIFYRPFVNGELDLLNTEPIWLADFMEQNDDDFKSTCPILDVDVMETEYGHTIFIAMPSKIAVLKYTHCLSSTPWSSGVEHSSEADCSILIKAVK